jgi:hypothetical protein
MSGLRDIPRVHGGFRGLCVRFFCVRDAARGESLLEVCVMERNRWPDQPEYVQGRNHVPRWIGAAFHA